MRFLTDEHISPAVAEQAAAKCPGIKIVALHDWRDGEFLGARDEVFLAEAAKEGMVLVTYDVRTIAPLLKSWAEAGVNHAGVVFVDQRTIAPQDFGELVAALSHLWKRERRKNWSNRVVFLRGAPEEHE